MSRETLANDIGRACDIMRRDNNCGGIMEYLEHLSWLMFLKFLDSQEGIFEAEASIAGRPYTRIIEENFQWSSWARKDFSGEELLSFVHNKLIPYLQSLTGSPERDIISSVFSDRNVVVMASPYNLKDVIEIVDGVDFQNADDIHTVSFVYEDLLKKLGSENRLAGEFYTPRPTVRFMVEVVGSQIGETVYDPACGTCGFLAESYVKMKEAVKGSRDHEVLQRHTFFGQEKKPLPALLGLMNMVLHGVLTPTVRRRNTLEENIRDITERYDVILTNPPFGGKENPQIQQNFPVRSQSTELLFLQHIMKKLKTSGSAATPRCGMVVPEGTLFRGGAFVQVKRDLLQNLNVHTIVSLPSGAFAPYSDVKTALLFFDRSGPTRNVWYYELPLPSGLKKFSKGRPLLDEHFDDCRKKLKTREVSDNSWFVSADEIANREYDLTARNPNTRPVIETRSPVEVLATVMERETEISSILREVQELLENSDDRE